MHPQPPSDYKSILSTKEKLSFLFVFQHLSMIFSQTFNNQKPAEGSILMIKFDSPAILALGLWCSALMQEAAI